MSRARFDTFGVQGKDFKADLLGPNSKPSKGLRKANLSPRTKALLEEVALSEQVLPSPRFFVLPALLTATFCKFHRQLELDKQTGAA